MSAARSQSRDSAGAKLVARPSPRRRKERFSIHSDNNCDQSYYFSTLGTPCSIFFQVDDRLVADLVEFVVLLRHRLG